MGRVKESLKDYFHFISNERMGAIWLMVLCVVLLILWLARDTWMATDIEPITISYIKDAPQEAEAQVQDSIAYFNFDPNGLPAEEWRKLGLSDKQINGIHNYEKAGGSFRKKEDLRKMYTVGDALYSKLEPYITIVGAGDYTEYDPVAAQEWEDEGNWEKPKISEDISAEENAMPNQHKEWKSVSVELNSATAEELTAIRGIGPSYAKSILKFRDLLGGYHSIDQLYEVYMFKDRPEVVAEVAPFMTIDTATIRTIDINTAEVEQFADHIYLDWNTARAIVAYRKMHGPFKNVAAIQGCVLVDDALFAKIAPYFKVH